MCLCVCVRARARICSNCYNTYNLLDNNCTATVVVTLTVTVIVAVSLLPYHSTNMSLSPCVTSCHHIIFTMRVTMSQCDCLFHSVTVSSCHYVTDNSHCVFVTVSPSPHYSVITSQLPSVPLSQCHCVINSSHRVSVNVSLSSFLLHHVSDTGNALYHHITVAVSMSPCHRHHHQVTIYHHVSVIVSLCYYVAVTVPLPS